MTQATRRVELSAQNVANVSTPGYKRRVSFSDVLAVSGVDSPGTILISAISDLAEGKPIETGLPTDLSIAGDGFFVVGGESRTLYTRGGQFRRDSDGRLLAANGLALQAQGGGDIVLASDEFSVAADGMVLENGEPVAKLAVVRFERSDELAVVDGGLFSAPDGAALDVDAPAVRQGFLEASNVSTGAEMVAMMEALRRAETGQRLINVYDDLLGRALSTFGQSS